MGRRTLVLLLLALSAPPAAAQSPCGTEVELARLDAGVAGPELRTPGGAPVIGGPFSLRVEGALANTAGAMVFAFTENPFFSPDYGATFWFGAPYGTVFFSTDADGRSPALFAAPAVDPFFCNEFGLFQGGVFDPAATGGVAVTNAVRIRVGEPRGTLFTGPYILSFPSYPITSIDAADFDGDGLIDVAASSVQEVAPDLAYVVIGLGRDDGGFDLGTPLPLSGAQAVRIADVDDDGAPDVVATSLSLLETQVFLGAGDGTFTQDPAHVVAVGNSPNTVILPDLDGDGSVDLVVANTADSTLTLASGNGDGSFGAPATVATGGLPHGVDAADLDEDGFLDLAVAAKGFDRVDLLFGDGTGGIATSTFVPAAGGPQGLELADLDEDGFEDLLAACIFANVVRVRLGNGDGTLNEEVAHATGIQPLAVQAADVDADGALDVVVGCRQQDNVSVFPGDGSGSLGSPLTYPMDFNLRGIAVVDTGADGELDVVAAGVINTFGTVRVLPGLVGGTFDVASEAPAAALPNDERWTSLFPTDVDGDGLLDLATFKPDDFGELARLAVHLADGAGGFSSALGSVSFTDVLDAGLGDLNGDGLADLVLPNYDTELLDIRLGDGAGNFVPFLTQDPVLGAGPEPRQLVLADLDLDGQLDLVLRAVALQTKLIVLPGTGTGSFVPTPSLVFDLDASEFPVVQYFQDPAIGKPLVGDFEGDGFRDVALFSGTFGTVLSGGASGFQLGTSFATPSPPRMIPRVGDLDGDGADELVYGTISPSSAVVVRTGGAAGASALFPIPDSLGVIYPYTPDMAVADFDGDGDADVVYGTSGMGLLYGLGDGTLEPTVSRFWLKGAAEALLPLDMDGNGTPDVVSLRVADAADQAIEIRTNLTGK